VGYNVLIVFDYETPVNVRGYLPDGPLQQGLRTVTAALAYDDDETGETIILIVHQAIYVPEMQSNLLSTMQLRLNDVQVNDCPKFLTDKPTAESHALIVPSTDSHNESPLLIPLTIQGVTSTFPTRKPTPEEYELCPRYELTYASPEYDPSDARFADQEEAAAETVARLLKTGDADRAQTRRLCHVSKSLTDA